MSRDTRPTSRLFDFCVGVLLAAMALYAAVQIVESVWLPLCIGVLVVGSLAAGGTAIWRRSRRW